jgi:hypothetical protein
MSLQGVEDRREIETGSGFVEFAALLLPVLRLQHAAMICGHAVRAVSGHSFSDLPAWSWLEE